MSRFGCLGNPSLHSYCRNLSLRCTRSLRSPHESRRPICRTISNLSTLLQSQWTWVTRSIWWLTPRWAHVWSVYWFCNWRVRHQGWPPSPQTYYPPVRPRPRPLAAQTSPATGHSDPVDEQASQLHLHQKSLILLGMWLRLRLLRLQSTHRASHTFTLNYCCVQWLTPVKSYPTARITLTERSSESQPPHTLQSWYSPSSRRYWWPR